MTNTDEPTIVGAALPTLSAPPPRTPATPIAPLVEWVILAALLYIANRDVADPGRLFTWIVGHPILWSLPALRPATALVLGIGNIFLMLHLASCLSLSRGAERLRSAAVAWFVFALVFLPAAQDMEQRWHVDEKAPATQRFSSQSHDGGTVQTEMALARLLAGQNPYGDHYNAPPMTRSMDSDVQAWKGIGLPDNPALHHLTYFPGVLVVSLPFYVTGRALGFFDERLVYLLCALVLAFVVGRLVDDRPLRRVIAAAVLLNPALRPYLVTGRNDVLALVPLALFALSLQRASLRAAAAWLGCAIACKQFALFIAPAFFVYVVAIRSRNWPRTLSALWPAIVVPLVVIAPFVAWDWRTFLDDTLFWTSRGGDGSYPLKWSGWGLSPLAYGLNLIDLPSEASPFRFGAPLVEVAVLVATCVALYRRPSAARLLVVAAVFLSTMLMFARSYSLSYIATPALLIGMAALLARKETA